MAKLKIELNETEIKEALLAAMKVKYPNVKTATLNASPTYDYSGRHQTGIYDISAVISE
jgi:hypothetical protein